MSFVIDPALRWSLIDGALGMIASFIVVSLLMPMLIRFFKHRGYVGVDVHKLERPEIAELGGVGIIFGVIAGLVITAVLVYFGRFENISTTFPLRGPNGIVMLTIYRAAMDARIIELALVVGVVGVVGLYDDFHPLKGRLKPVLVLTTLAPSLMLTALAVSPLVFEYYTTVFKGSPGDPLRLSYFFTPYIEIPGRPPISLVILFPLIALFAITIGANAMNMMDVYNGIMPGTTILVATALAVSALILQRYEAFFLLLPFMGAILAYYRFNRHPAKVFSGDVGSLSVGAGLVTIAFLSRLEIVLLIAFIPFVINGLDTLLTVGFRERRDMDARPTLFQADGKIALNPDPRAPVPLANLFLTNGARSEQELIRDFIRTVGFSSLLSVLTAVIIWGLRVLGVQIS